MITVDNDVLNVDGQAETVLKEWGLLTTQLIEKLNKISGKTITVGHMMEVYNNLLKDESNKLNQKTI